MKDKSELLKKAYAGDPLAIVEHVLIMMAKYSNACYDKDDKPGFYTADAAREWLGRALTILERNGIPENHSLKP